jgi:ABC-type nitrate/sulfonate/bicarbonate transport system ATPase subunit
VAGFVEFAAAGFRLPDGRALLTDLSLTVAEGETLALIGRSGSGKTTALKLVNALLLPTDGPGPGGREADDRVGSPSGSDAGRAGSSRTWASSRI